MLDLDTEWIRKIFSASSKPPPRPLPPPGSSSSRWGTSPTTRTPPPRRPPPARVTPSGSPSAPPTRWASPTSASTAPASPTPTSPTGPPSSAPRRTSSSSQSSSSSAPTPRRASRSTSSTGPGPGGRPSTCSQAPSRASSPRLTSRSCPATTARISSWPSCASRLATGSMTSTYSLTTWAWSVKEVEGDVSLDAKAAVSHIIASKVMLLGGGTVGWVDLWRGIVACNVLEEMPVLRFIPLPPLMPGHREGPKSSPWPIQNVSCSGGLIKYVEIEKHQRHDPDERPFDDIDTLYEADCLAKPKVMGWKAMTWYRRFSCDHWSKGCMAYDKEISVDRPTHSMLLPELTDDDAGELTLKDMLASYPVPSLASHCDDVVYMLCESKSGSKKSWLISVDLKKKILVELAPFHLEGYYSPAHPSELSNYLNVAPAEEATSEEP